MTVRWGIIGCGDVCEVKSGPPLYRCANSELVVVMRREEAKAADFARRHGVAHHTTDARAVIDDPRVNAVYIATPPGSHLEHALATAAAGKPCYVEKPMARSASECRQMAVAFESRRIPLFVAYYRRALPRFTRIREMIDDGRFGTLRAIRHAYHGLAARDGQPAVGPPRKGWREDVAVAGGGLFLDLGSHVVDLIEFLCGPLGNVRGHARRRSRPPGPGIPEDTVVASFTTESGALGSLEHVYHVAEALDRLEIVGDRGRLTASVFGSEPLEWHGPQGLETIHVEHPRHVQEPLVQTIVDELLGKGASCPSTGATALRASAVMDRILSDYYGGRDDEFWRRPFSWPGGSV